jgi:hypothetical protein
VEFKNIILKIKWINQFENVQQIFLHVQISRLKTAKELEFLTRRES